MTTKYKAPISIKEALQRINQLYADIIDIERQLAEKDRLDMNTGERMSPASYRRWRSAALASRMHKLVERKELQLWVQNRRRAILAKEAGVYRADDPRSLIVATTQALREFFHGDGDIDEAENRLHKLLQLMEGYLMHAESPDGARRADPAA